LGNYGKGEGWAPFSPAFGLKVGGIRIIEFFNMNKLSIHGISIPLPLVGIWAKGKMIKVV
jgi:hypothetical protein